MTLEKAYEKYYELLVKGTTDGLTHNDYIEVDKLSKLKYENDLYKKFWVALMKDINYLLDDLKMDVNLVSDIDPKCMEYIYEHCYLLPLVLANKNEKYVKPFQEGSYLFMCQFHDDEYPSLEVTDYNSKYKCFACGESGNVITYLSKIENMKQERKVIDLLRRIYNLDELYLSQSLNDLALKYRFAILSDSYKKLLERGYTLFKANNLLSIDGYFIDKMYEDRFYTIHRLENGEKDPYFEFKENDTYKLVLDRKEYQPFIDNVKSKI